MRVLRMFAAMVSFGLAVYLFIPVGWELWNQWQLFRGRDDDEVRHFLIWSVGGHHLTGWQIWAFLGGLAFIGLLLAGFGFYLLRPEKSTASDDN